MPSSWKKIVQLLRPESLHGVRLVKTEDFHFHLQNHAAFFPYRIQKRGWYLPITPPSSTFMNRLSLSDLSGGLANLHIIVINALIHREVSAPQSFAAGKVGETSPTHPVPTTVSSEAKPLVMVKAQPLHNRKCDAFSWYELFVANPNDCRCAYKIMS